MAKKKVPKETKAIEEVINRLEFEWAKKRGKRYPLSLGDMAQYQREELIEEHFQIIKYIFAKSRNNYVVLKSLSANSADLKPWPLWTYDEAACDDKQYKLMSEAKMNKMVKAIDDVVRCPISSYTKGYTELSLLHKTQSGEENSISYEFGRAAIMVRPSSDSLKPKFLKIRDNEKVNATLYAGYDIDDEDPCCPPMIGFLVFAGEDSQSHAVELDKFSAIIEIGEGKEYIFTFFSKADDLIFTKRLHGLGLADLFHDCDIASGTNEAPDYSEVAEIN